VPLGLARVKSSLDFMQMDRAAKPADMAKHLQPQSNKYARAISLVAKHLQPQSNKHARAISLVVTGYQER